MEALPFDPMPAPENRGALQKRDVLKPLFRNAGIYWQGRKPPYP